MYIYENHMGGFYTSKVKLEYKDLDCEQCGDSDTEIGYFTNKEELYKCIMKNFGHIYYKEDVEKWISRLEW